MFSRFLIDIDVLWFMSEAYWTELLTYLREPSGVFFF